jgi:hypothetical protein
MQKITLQIPTPCHESWDAMTPNATGRHCAACAKTVVDFSEKTDAEILHYLARASGEICGRVRAAQVGRTLIPAMPVRTGARWRSWLAAAVAIWGLREGSSLSVAARVPMEQRAHQPGQKPSHPTPTKRPKLYIKGVVRDSATGQPRPGVAVFLKGENRSTVTDSAGRFSLRAPAGRPVKTRHVLVLNAAGYHSQQVKVPVAARAAGELAISLLADPAATGVEIVGIGSVQSQRILVGMMPLPGSTVGYQAPQSKPARSFFRWLTQPFRR